MNRTVTDVIANLILPPAGPLLLALFGLFLLRWKRRLGTTLAVSGIALLWMMSLGVVGNGLLRLLEPPPVARHDLARVGAIVVIGGGVNEHSPEYAGPVLGPDSFQRLRYGARLARETGLPILVSGGSPYGHIPEAEVMASVLKADFALEARWIEGASPTTAQNAAQSFAVLARERKTRIALVTTAWHMRRAQRAFEAAGFAVVPAPTGYVGDDELRLLDLLPSAGGLWQTRTALWELLGSIWYALQR